MSDRNKTAARPVPPLEWFENAVHTISEKLGPPSRINIRGEIALRYVNRSTESAITLKLARYVSGLSAGSILLRTGHIQELCTLQRTLDELHEDILFLALPFLGKEKTTDHDKYLDAFWEEEPDFRSFSGNQKNRYQLPRKNIRSYLAKVTDDESIDHKSISASAYLARGYSGYVHGAAPQLHELLNFDTARFQVLGCPSSSLVPDHAHDFENQFFRGVTTIAFVAQVVEAEPLTKEAYEMHNRLEPFFHD